LKYTLKNFPKFGKIQTDFPSEEYIEHLVIYHGRINYWKKGFEAELREIEDCPYCRTKEEILGE